MNVPPLPRTPGGTRRFFDAYTQGLTTSDVERLFEAENDAGQPFDELGLEGVVESHATGSAKELGWAAFAAVEHHTREKRLFDDLTVLVARKLPPLPVTAVGETAAVGV